MCKLSLSLSIKSFFVLLTEIWRKVVLQLKHTEIATQRTEITTIVSLYVENAMCFTVLQQFVPAAHGFVWKVSMKFQTHGLFFASTPTANNYLIILWIVLYRIRGHFYTRRLNGSIQRESNFDVLKIKGIEFKFLLLKQLGWYNINKDLSKIDIICQN